LKTVILTVLAVLLFCAMGSAAPTYLGPSGLANVPLPTAMGSGQYNLFYNMISGDADVSIFGGNVGLGMKTPIEIGATVVNPEGGTSETIINAKVALQVGEVEPIDLAVGVIDLSDEFDQTVYLSAGKMLTRTSRGGVPPVYGVLGFGNSDGGTLDGVFLGVTTRLPAGIEAHVEYDTEDLNLGLNYTVSDVLNLRADAVSGDIGFGVSYKFAR